MVDGIVGGGYLGVEFFFILTGLFLAKRLSGEQEPISSICACIESKHYIGKKIKEIYPFFLLSTLVGTGIKLLCGRFGVQQLPSIVGDFMLLQNYGFTVISGTGVLWYLCSLFFTLWIVYPIARRNYEIYVRYVAPILVVLIMGFILHNYGKLEVPNSYFGFVNTGLMRGICGITLGMVLYEISRSVSPILNRNRKWYYLGAVFELILLVLIFEYMIQWNSERAKFDGYVVGLISILVIVAYSKTTVLNKMCSNKVIYMGGKLSSVLFMNHFYWYQDFKPTFLNKLISSEPIVKILCFFLSVVTSVLIIKIVDIITNHKKSIKFNVNGGNI